MGKKDSARRKELLESLDGEEFLSIKFEGAVLFEKDKGLWQRGKIIKKKFTTAELQDLHDDMFESEFGVDPRSSRAFGRFLQAEGLLGKKKKLKKVM